MTRRLVLGLVLLASGVAAAQDSQFGIRGLGQPGRHLSARAMGSGGAFAPFDAMSGLNPAVIAGGARVTAFGTFLGTGRTFEASGVSRSLDATRFPMMGFNTPFFLDGRLSVQFSTYLDRSYEIATTDTITLSGGDVEVSDVVKSDGAVSDLTFSVARRLAPTVQVGASVHVLLGSTRVRITRDFDDESFIRFQETSVLDYRGLGFTAGAHLAPIPAIGVSLYARRDGTLTTRDADAKLGSANLPVALGGGILYRLASNLRVATSGEWRSWSDAQEGLRGNGITAYNTYEVSTGLEWGGASRVLRLGARYARMPFGVGSQPREVNVSVGFGFAFSGGRGLIDVALERMWRDGANASERLWNLGVGLTVRP